MKVCFKENNRNIHLKQEYRLNKKGTEQEYLDDSKEIKKKMEEKDYELM